MIREIGSLVPISEYVIPAAQHLALEAPPGPERDELENRISATETVWITVKDKAEDRQNVIEIVFPSAQAYDDAFKALNQWMGDVESRVVNMQPVVCHENALNSQLQVVKVCAWLTYK